MPDYTNPTDLARHIIEYDPTPEGSGLKMLGVAAEKGLPLPWPDGLAPEPTPLDEAPASDAALPQADVLLVTWTVAELRALADVLTPGYQREDWYPYDRNFADYEPHIRGGAPALRVRRLGSYFMTRLGNKTVLCFKSELHLNQDGKSIPGQPGVATLPVKDLWAQLISEVQPELVLTVGTAGATFADHELGDVMVTTRAKFRLQKEFRNAPFANSEYHSSFVVPTKHLLTANQLMLVHKDRLREPAFGPPTKRYPFQQSLIPAPENRPDTKIAGFNMPDLPILTTDYFEFGTSSNGLELEGCGVEMGDAVLGMVAEELAEDAPNWAVIRNASDPQINGDLPIVPRMPNMQVHWAVWYYETYGYWTSVNSAIAAWAIIAGA